MARAWAGFNLFHVNLVEALKNRKVQIGIAAAAILLAAALTLVWIFQPKNNSDASANPSTAATPSTSADGTAATTSSSDPSASASPGACVAPDEAGFEPVRYSIERLGVDANVVSLGHEEDGAIAAPPKDEPKTASWWNEGPKVATNAGQVVLSIHTYQKGGAVGNQLYEGGTSQLQEGDVLKLYAADGRVACYKYTEAKKIAVSDFKPDSDLLERRTGDPTLAIIVCWDHNDSNNEWDSRVFFMFKPTTA